ncbi:MAG: hypothetical protein J6V13_03745 [Paludibacteraceae bacterium]|nr:hypothetical protein [Paludibacteraceae bacterium]
MSHHVKTTDGYDVKVPNQGQVNYNTVAGSIGLANAVFGNGGLLGGLFGGNRGYCIPSEDHCVNRYELAMEKELAAKDSEIALLKANTYQDQKMLEVYRYFEGKISEINQRLAGQDVRNQGYVDAFRELAKDIDYKINLEAERRESADNKIVCYANGTFATKLIADYTAGTTTTAMETFNPLCCCGNGR